MGLSFLLTSKIKHFTHIDDHLNWNDNYPKLLYSKDHTQKPGNLCIEREKFPNFS